MNILINTNRPEGDGAIAVTRLRYSATDKTLITAPSTSVSHASSRLFIKGPIPLEWLSAVARLPGKCLNVAMAIQWLLGMSGGKPVKLTSRALRSLNVSDDTTSDCLRRMEQAGLIDVTRQSGQRPVICVRDNFHGGHHGKT
jgi:hypothetical protein